MQIWMLLEAMADFLNNLKSMFASEHFLIKSVNHVSHNFWF